MNFYFPEDFFVRFSETDAAGVVHFTHFLRWAENAEGNFFRRNGLKIMEKSPAGTLRGFPRVAVSAEYFAPARYADRIRVGIRPRSLPAENSRCIEWIFEISRVEKTGAETLLARGSWKSVCSVIAADGKIAPATSLPSSLFSALRTFF